MRIVLALLFLVRLAHADVGVVVSGDPNMQARALDLAQRWLQDNGHTLVAAPLGTAATSLVDCFVIEDMACARKIVTDHAKGATIAFVRVDMVAGDTRDYTLTAYWFVRGHDPVSAKRSCKQCDDDALGVAVGILMRDVTRKAAGDRGRLLIGGTAPGMVVKIDGEEVGAPPISQDVAAGSYELVFVLDGTPVEVRRVDIEAGSVVQLEAPHRAEAPTSAPARPSRTLPALLLVGGIAATAAGGVLLYYGSQDASDSYVHTNGTEIGLPLALAGAFAIGAGTSLWFTRSGSDAQVGVSGTF